MNGDENYSRNPQARGASLENRRTPEKNEARNQRVTHIAAHTEPRQHTHDGKFGPVERKLEKKTSHTQAISLDVPEEIWTLLPKAALCGGP